MKIPLFVKFLLRRFIIHRYYERDGYPIRCPYCDSSNVRAVTKDTIDYHVCEEEYFCMRCKNSVAYWAYGYFGPMEDYTFTWEWYKDAKKKLGRF